MKTLTRTVAAALACLALGACTPQQWINDVFGPEAGAATRVAECESGMNPAAVSAGGGNHGLFQINSVHRGAFESLTGQPWTAVYDAQWNTKFAKHLHDQAGWQPWTCQP
jgi:Lysozyme like domain